MPGVRVHARASFHLETNATKGLVLENSLTLQRGDVRETAVVKIAQTFRSGTNDIDAIDFVDMLLADDQQTDPDALNDVYVLVNFSRKTRRQAERVVVPGDTAIHPPVAS
jgi:hypothetical protein